MLKSTLGKISFIVVLVIFVGFVAYAVQAAENKDIVDTAQEAGNFTTLCKMLAAADLVEMMQSAGPFTVFAPSDEAFAKLPPGMLDDLMADKDKLKALLLHHIVPGKITAADILMLRTANTAGGDELTIDAMGDDVMIDDARITKTDIQCSNGIIHVIDTVLVP